jgi:hypothetical protein
MPGLNDEVHELLDQPVAPKPATPRNPSAPAQTTDGENTP